jgi:hypothetical protein
MENQTPPPKSKPTKNLKEIKEFLDSEGLKIETFKFIAMAYKTSWHKLSGVAMRFGDLWLRIGPDRGAVILHEPTTQKLNLMDHNPFAIYGLVHDWLKSPLKTKGLVFLVDDVLIRIGPQKNPMIIVPRSVLKESKLGESKSQD